MSHPTHDHDHDHDHGHRNAPAPEHAAPQATQRRSVLAWPAWLRVLAVLPALLALWLAVWWANAGAGAMAW